MNSLILSKKRQKVQGKKKERKIAQERGGGRGRGEGSGGGGGRKGGNDELATVLFS